MTPGGCPQPWGAQRREVKAETAWGMSWHPLPPHQSAGRGALADRGEGELAEARIALSILWFHCPVVKGSHLWDEKP